MADKKIPIINGLRGVAILAVIFHHSFFPSILYGLKDGVSLSVANVVFSSGWLGVNLFFFLSGLVLYLPYARDERHFSSKSDLSSFYFHRAKRLLPLFYFTTLILLVFYTGRQLTDVQLYKSIFYNFFVIFPFTNFTFFQEPNWVTWSLGVEVWFSVIFPAVVVSIKRFGWKKVIICTILLCLMVRTVGRILYEGPTRPAILFPADTIFGRLDEFMLGMLAAHLYVNDKLKGMISLQFFIGLCLISLSLIGWGWWYRGNGSYIISAMLSMPFDVGLLLITNSMLKTKTILGSIISFWPLQLAGMMCYSLYLWHGVIVSKYAPTVHGIYTYPIYLIITFVISWFTYRYIEFRGEDNWRKLLP